MKLQIRKSNINDLYNIYDLHIKCFINKSDHWYKSIITQYLNNSIVIELINENKIIGVLLQGNLIPCNQELQNQNNNILELYNICNNYQEISINEDPPNKKENILNEDPPNKKYNIYEKDIFIPCNDKGNIFFKNMDHIKEHYGIVMICIDPRYRGYGLAKKLINKHIQNNSNKLLCLHTRKSNIIAYNLYKNMGYEHIGFIKNKYFLPNEDSIFMIK